MCKNDIVIFYLITWECLKFGSTHAPCLSEFVVSILPIPVAHQSFQKYSLGLEAGRWLGAFLLKDGGKIFA